VRGRHVGSGLEGGRGGREKGGSSEPDDHALGRSRGGFGSKIHLVAEGHGIPLAVHVTAGQVNECTELEMVVNRVHIGRRRRPVALAGDKGYSTDRIRGWLRRHAIRAVIPRRKDQHPDDQRVHFDRRAYRRRSAIEQCNGWLKECRRVATRFEKLAVNFLAMIHLAFIERYFRILSANGA
jgi:transposase